MCGTSSINGLDEKAIKNLIAQCEWKTILGGIAINNQFSSSLTQLCICVLEIYTCLRASGPSSDLFIKSYFI